MDSSFLFRSYDLFKKFELKNITVKLHFIGILSQCLVRCIWTIILPWKVFKEAERFNTFCSYPKPPMYSFLSLVKNSFSGLNVADSRNLDCFMSSDVSKVVKIIHKLFFLGTSDSFVFKRDIRFLKCVRIRCYTFYIWPTCLSFCTVVVVDEACRTERIWGHPNWMTIWFLQVELHTPLENSLHGIRQGSFPIYSWTKRRPIIQVFVHEGSILCSYYVVGTKRKNGKYPVSYIQYFQFVQFEVSSWQFQADKIVLINFIEKWKPVRIPMIRFNGECLSCERVISKTVQKNYTYHRGNCEIIRYWIYNIIPSILNQWYRSIISKADLSTIFRGQGEYTS